MSAICGAGREARGGDRRENRPHDIDEAGSSRPADVALAGVSARAAAGPGPPAHEVEALGVAVRTLQRARNLRVLELMRGTSERAVVVCLGVLP